MNWELDWTGQRRAREKLEAKTGGGGVEVAPTGSLPAAAAKAKPLASGSKRKAPEGNDGKCDSEQGRSRKASRRDWDKGGTGPPRSGTKRLGKKINTALIFGYNGAAYQGLQINPDAVTVESVLEQSLYDAGCIDEANHKNLHKINWTRTARTDKGVSAVGQVVCAKLVLGDEASFCQRVNAKLPPDVRLFTHLRITKGFNAKNNCSARTYIYIMPTYGLQKVSDFEKSEFAAAASRRHDRDAEADVRARLIATVGEGVAGVAGAASAMRVVETAAGGGGDASSASGDDPATLYRAGEAERVALADCLRAFVGTKPHHNFTIGKKPGDPSAMRYILECEPEEYFVGPAGVEFVRIRIHGQSFMLNQIRKMIGMAVAVVRGTVTRETLDECFKPKMLHVPKAPALGLFLQRCHFEHYNKKVKRLKVREPMSSAYDRARSDMNAFRDGTISAYICRQELATAGLAFWLRALSWYPWGGEQDGKYVKPDLAGPRGRHSRAIATESFKNAVSTLKGALCGGKDGLVEAQALGKLIASLVETTRGTKRRPPTRHT